MNAKNQDDPMPPEPPLRDDQPNREGKCPVMKECSITRPDPIFKTHLHHLQDPLAEAKASYGLGALKVDALGIRQGSFEFFATRLQRAGRMDILQQLNLGNIDTYGYFGGSNRLFKFDQGLFVRNVNFTQTPAAAQLVP